MLPWAESSSQGNPITYGPNGKRIRWTWHHLDDFDPNSRTTTMQLVRLDVHNASGMAHSGGKI